LFSGIEITARLKRSDLAREETARQARAKKVFILINYYKTRSHWLFFLFSSYWLFSTVKKGILRASQI
jgi:hypothetical protein